MIFLLWPIYLLLTPDNLNLLGKSKKGRVIIGKFELPRVKLPKVYIEEIQGKSTLVRVSARFELARGSNVINSFD